jgi:hypothetical protein
MSTPKRFVQAYRQAPWRIQTQRAAIVLIIVIMSAGFVWVMLNITVQAGTAGLHIQDDEYQTEELQRQIASLRTQYADLTSAGVMLKRATTLGFQQVKPEDIQYIVVPNYAGRQSVLESSPATVSDSKPLIKPVFTESLWEWMMQGVVKMSEQPGGTTP